MPTLALIAHDGKKDEMEAFARAWAAQLARYDLVATGTTAVVVRRTGLEVRAVLSGPRGGDVQIAGEVLAGGVAAVFFFVEPMEAHPHDPDIRTLERICTLTDTPLAMSPAGAGLMLKGMTVG